MATRGAPLCVCVCALTSTVSCFLSGSSVRCWSHRVVHAGCCQDQGYAMDRSPPKPMSLLFLSLVLMVSVYQSYQSH